jgi:transcription-repair coupling factor (superfamily II helicase)
MLSQEARRRLKAVEEFSVLGSGFNIALQDLDIRGAGNLLGAEQSGFIADMGFDTYNRILNEAVTELKETEFRELYTRESHPVDQERFLTDCHVDTDMELLFPDHYISQIAERVELYRKLDSIENERDLEDFREMLEDRFGPLPSPSDDLLKVVQLRWLARRLGVEKIVLKKSVLITYFVSDPDSPFYRSDRFKEVIGNIQAHPHLFRMREDQEKLSLRTDRVSSVEEAFRILGKLSNGQTNESSSRPG